jgi:hypothetical protein
MTSPIAEYSNGFPNNLEKWQELMYEFWETEHFKNYRMGFLTQNEAESLFVLDLVEENALITRLTETLNSSFLKMQP